MLARHAWSAPSLSWESPERSLMIAAGAGSWGIAAARRPHAGAGSLTAAAARTSGRWAGGMLGSPGAYGAEADEAERS